ncbi:receptor-type adenlyate cyclase, partial [Trypanosoma grayi]|uniref:receptor-type adenlyate cyclase n=1 Tax=Trypanosoma grayi TaxID=71804 RepID=UPI0004F47107
LVAAPRGAVGQSTEATRVVQMLSIDAKESWSTNHIREAAAAGFLASLYSRQYIVCKGVVVNMTRKVVELDQVYTVINADLKASNDLLLVLGPKEDAPLLRAIPALKAHDCVSFAPITGSSQVRGWNPNLYFLRPEPAAELLALIRYAVNQLRVLRLGFMYLQGVFFGDSEYTQAVRVLGRMGYGLSGVFTVKSSYTASADTDEFNAEWEKFADTHPQAVIVFGAQVNDTVKFIKTMLTDPRTRNSFLLGPFALQDILLSTWREAVSGGGVPFVRGQVITTGVNPLASDTQYEAINRFQKEMRQYLSNHTDEYKSTNHFLENDHDGELMVSGWIAGEVLSQALSNPEWIKDRATFKESLFNQRRYLVDDLVIGDFGGECVGNAAMQGAACKCNQGGRTVYMKRFVENYHVEVLDKGNLVLPLSECNTSSLRIVAPFNGIAMRFTDRPQQLHAILEMGVGYYAAQEGSPRLSNAQDLTMQYLLSTVVGACDALEEEMSKKHLHGVAGLVTQTMMGMTKLTLLDPVEMLPSPNRFRRNVVRLSTTLEQEFFVVAQYLGNTTFANAHAVIRSDEAPAVVDVLRRSLVTYGGSLLSYALLGADDALESHLPRDGDVFVVGLAAADVAVVAGHLAKH